MAINIEGLNRLSKYIEENIRVSDQTSVQYIDPRGHIQRLNSKQNQVIFGRRGSGKSLLVKTLSSVQYNDAIYTKVNLEDFKDVSFPNSILQVLIKFYDQLIIETEKSYSWYQFVKAAKARSLINEIKSKIKSSKDKLQLPDNYDENIKEKEASKTNGGTKVGAPGTETNFGVEISNETEKQKSLKVDKLNTLKNEITDLKKLISEVSFFNNNRHIFLVLDDFYFVNKPDQSFFVDFFHRLSKDTPLFLKVATIKHRTSLYIQTAGTYIGIEMGHDAQPLELDYTLDQFIQLQNFMWDLLKQANTNSNANVDLDNLITENAFKQLCLASGGVPRDFLSLFIKLCNKIINGNNAISKPEVNEIAIENSPNKFENFKRDTAEEKEVLEHYLQYLKDFMLNSKKTNMCLVSNNDIANYNQIKQAIKELVDLRLIHLVDNNTSSAPADGKRYSAYMIDIGLYPNSKPRITQIEPGLVDEEGRKDNIRSAPKVDLDDFKQYVTNLNLQHNLQLTE